MKERISKGLENPDPKAVAQLEQFVHLLLEKNKVMNLTAITDVDKVVDLHLLDSAALLPYLRGKTLIDVGTGAGFPAIPLKILKPDLEITLLDALEKRLLWLEEVADILGLEQLSTLHGRGEELSHKAEYREQFDMATARAVADLRILSELVLPFVKVGGLFLAMKAKTAQEELEQAQSTISALGGKVLEIVDYDLAEQNHRLVLIEKISETPKAYPRRWARIKNNPIS